ncbi:MAG: hypothetical protein JWM44_4221, partial [Bacilli bacterium]|nr:hypothetical protein [Bacilli bacterium]
MSIYGIQLSVIIIALITAYMGYQFNFRAKKRESFLKELSNSYIEVYFPMNELLKDIINKEDIAKKRELTHEFFERFKGPESKIKFIGSSFLLEYFYELENLYLIYNSDPNRTNESSFLNKLKSFSNKIEYEFWEAHDIIYEDHLKFKNLSNKNPLVI